MWKKKFIKRKRITLQAAIFDCSEAVAHSHLFSKIYRENTVARVLLLVKLQTDCSEQRLFTNMTPPGSEAAVHSHPFLKLPPGNKRGRVILLVKLQTD